MMTENSGETFSDRYERVHERLRRACQRAGRDPGDVQLVAVSKKHGPDRVREAADCGVTVFGESKVQEARAKIPLCPGHVRWHLIGHLQTNKVKYAVRLFETIHSVDSIRLLEALDAATEATGVSINAFLEVNVSGEPAKFGLPPEAVPEVLERSLSLMRVDVVGLMTMPPFAEDPEKTRRYFSKLRALRDQWRESYGIPLDELSMGMSHDMEVAIEEGATWVRVGTDLFGAR